MVRKGLYNALRAFRCDKNSDRMLDNVEEVLMGSTNQFLVGHDGILSGTASGGSSLIGKAFLSQLNELIKNNLLKCKSRFVRCIKANNQFAPVKTDRKLVFEQLVSSVRSCASRLCLQRVIDCRV